MITGHHFHYTTVPKQSSGYKYQLMPWPPDSYFQSLSFSFAINQNCSFKMHSFLVKTSLTLCGFVTIIVSTMTPEMKTSPVQAPRSLSKHSLTKQCPPEWLQEMLFPCGCNTQNPLELQCLGPYVNDETMKQLEYNLLYVQKLMRKKRPQLLTKMVSQFRSLQVSETLLTSLHAPIFKLFTFDNITLDSNQWLRTVYLHSFKKPIHLKNFTIRNMKNVTLVWCSPQHLQFQSGQAVWSSSTGQWATNGITSTYSCSFNINTIPFI